MLDYTQQAWELETNILLRRFRNPVFMQDNKRNRTNWQQWVDEVSHARKRQQKADTNGDKK